MRLIEQGHAHQLLGAAAAAGANYRLVTAAAAHPGLAHIGLAAGVNGGAGQLIIDESGNEASQARKSASLGKLVA